MFTQERTLAEHGKLVEGIMKRDQKRRNRIEAAGIDYECPDMVRLCIHLFSCVLQLIILNALPQIEDKGKVILEITFANVNFHAIVEAPYAKVGCVLVIFALFVHFCKLGSCWRLGPPPFPPFPSFDSVSERSSCLLLPKFPHTIICVH